MTGASCRTCYSHCSPVFQFAYIDFLTDEPLSLNLHLSCSPPTHCYSSVLPHLLPFHSTHLSQCHP